MSDNNSANKPDNKPAKPDLILVIDNGTQSVRAMLFDLQGNLVAKSQIALEAYYSAQPGWAEQDAEYFWQKLAEACQSLWLDPNVVDNGLKEQIVAVSLTTQRNSVVNLDQQAKPLRPVMLWLDQRLAKSFKPLPWYWRLAFLMVGQGKSVNYFRRKAQANWIAENQPQIWAKTDKFLLLSGYLIYQLCGQFKESLASNIGYLPFNYKKQCWASRFDWKWQALPVTAEMLPELVKPGETIGQISELASSLTGIKGGLPLIASASDKACEVLGCGCIEPTSASLSYGTTATININTPSYVEPQAFIPPFPSAVPGFYNSEVMIFRGFWMVSWFKQQFGMLEVHKAAEQNVTPESLLDDLVKQVPPGSMGLMLQPYWSPGIKNLEAKGAIIGFGDVHTRAHVYRSVLEGLAYALKQGKDSLEKRQGKKISRLVISGGGSQSDAAMQLTADIFNLPVYRPHTYETSGLGAAINVAVGLGYYPDYTEAISHMTRIETRFEPNKANVALYARLYSQVYKKMYRRLRPIYRQIKEITGYPE